MRADLLVAGSGEAREGGASYRERIVRRGETSAEAWREKAIFVLGEMERRLQRWAQVGRRRPRRRSTPCTISTPSWPTRSCARGAAHAGLTWHYCRPPVQDLEYEMDCRGVAVEHSVD